ncbi:MAG: thymidine phosphorylase [Clostridia bacterium]|nr:thymidine phosphorylase [Clostridia bacterium]
MNIQEIIAKKRDNKKLNEEEIRYFVSEYTKGNITDYQAAALIMAIYINGMSRKETTSFALEMANSGKILDLSEISNTIVDKHSTGGVGDKITIILMPIIASLGIPVVKMSGRGLGFTGGTADKLEAIPGYRTNITTKELINNVKKVGISLITQTSNLTPADKKIYAIRDAINCMDSMPLIASSIMSKKIASGANKLVLDVTCGSGAFMKNKEDAIKLSKIMKSIGKLAKMETICILTNMNEPLGHSIGNTLEIIEAIQCLKGDIPQDIKEIITVMGSYIIKLADKGNNLEENRKMILENIQNGKAYNKFLELVKNQNGDIEYIKDIKKFEKAKYIIPVISKEDGYVSEINAEEIGKISVSLGAGRTKKEDIIDKAVGIILNKKITDKVSKGEVLAYIHSNDKQKGEEASKQLINTYKISEIKLEKERVVLEVI